MDLEKKRWCYGCGETKLLIPEYWSWANKEHTRFRTKCRKCTNFDSKVSHRIHYKSKKKVDKTYETKENMLKLDKKQLVDMLCASLSRENEKTKIINEAIDKLYCWGEALIPEFQQEMLKILNTDDNDRN